jgi:hypothetical protein
LRRPCTTRTTYNNNPSSHAAQTCTQPIPSTIEKRGVPVYYYSHPCSYTAHLHHGRNLPRPVLSDTNTDRVRWTKPLPLRANTHNTHTPPTRPFPLQTAHPQENAERRTPKIPCATAHNSATRRLAPSTYLPTFLDRQFQFQFQPSPVPSIAPSVPAQLLATLPSRFACPLPSAQRRPDLTRAPAALLLPI